MSMVLRRGLRLAPFLFAAALMSFVALGASGPASASAAIRHSAPRIHHGRPPHSTSTNWSGYADTGGTYTDVKGSWTQPSVTCGSSETSYSSFWVGIDGDTDSTVEQTGTDSDCSNGTPTYYAWYEMYPKFPVNLSNPVSPGDTLTAEVKYIGSGKFQLTITDSNSQHGWSFTTTQTLKHAKLASAEWIAEAPSGSGGVLPLSNFGTVSFTNCTSNYGAINANGQTVDQIKMATSGGQTKAQPSSLGSGGESFSVGWKHS